MDLYISIAHGNSLIPAVKSQRDGINFIVLLMSVIGRVVFTLHEDVLSSSKRVDYICGPFWKTNCPGEGAAVRPWEYNNPAEKSTMTYPNVRGSYESNFRLIRCSRARPADHHNSGGVYVHLPGLRTAVPR